MCDIHPIEAAMANCAIITGPFVFNWQNLYEEMIESNSCLMIKEPKELEQKITELIENKEYTNNLRKNAITFSKKIFFEELKLLNFLNKILKDDA